MHYAYINDPYNGNVSGGLLYLTNATLESFNKGYAILAFLISITLLASFIFIKSKAKVINIRVPTVKVKQKYVTFYFALLSLSLLLAALMYDVIIAENNVFLNEYNYF